MHALPTIDVTMLAYREPDIASNIRSWLPHASRVIVVVGASSEVERMGLPADDPDTLDIVRSISDPDGKISVVTRPGRYWSAKNEMQLAAQAEATSDIVWQVDADEYYLPEHVERARCELADSGWELAGMPHLIFWRSTKHILVRKGTKVGVQAWLAPARIWRRKEGRAFMHLPYNRIRREDGRVIEVGCKVLAWGTCFHLAWVDARSVRFRLDFHKARNTVFLDQDWWSHVWTDGCVPDHGVHPLLRACFPEPYFGPLPEAISPRNEPP